jgi:hypothetical protein
MADPGLPVISGQKYFKAEKHAGYIFVGWLCMFYFSVIFLPFYLCTSSDDSFMI